MLETISKTYALSIEFQKKYKSIFEELPFHFNILDETKVNENSHSKILSKIFQFKEKGQNVYLKSFLESCEINLPLKSPVIKVEKERIDISIIDNDFALIIENKIHYAVDQDNQVDNYIKKILARPSYKLNHIYIIYLTRFGFKKVTENSFSREWRKKIGNRFIEINYYKHVLPWLKENVLPSLRSKDKLLKFGIYQYIDHLEGLLKIRSKFSKMTNEIQDYFHKKLNLSDNLIENDKILEATMKNINNCYEEVHKIRINLRNGLRKKFLKLLYHKLSQKDIGWKCAIKVNKNAKLEEANNRFFGFRNNQYKFEGTNLFFSIEIQNWNMFKCGIFGADNSQKQKLIELFSKKDIQLIDTRDGWLIHNIENYKYFNKKIGYTIYNDYWNQFYAENLEGMTNVFFFEVEKVFSIWKEISKKDVT